MGFGYSDVFLVTFLTSPGVIIPQDGTPVGGVSIPTLPTNWAALWQCFWYWVLTLPAQKSEGARWTMFVLYLIFLGLYAYFILRLRATK